MVIALQTVHSENLAFHGAPVFESPIHYGRLFSEFAPRAPWTRSGYLITDNNNILTCGPLLRTADPGNSLLDFLLLQELNSLMPLLRIQRRLR